MEGKFPGSPDVDTWEITEAYYDHVRDELRTPPNNWIGNR